MLTPCLASTILWICWPVSSGFRPWTWLVVIGRSHCQGKFAAGPPLPLIWDSFSSRSCRLPLIFECLHAYGLQLKSTKCHLFRTSVPLLGHIVGRRGLECDPKKIEDVKSWPIPDCLKSVRQFLGFVGYYRRFVPGFADLAEPLVALTGKDVPFV